MKNQHIRGNCLKRVGRGGGGLGQLGGLAKKEKASIFEEGLIPQCTLWVTPFWVSFNKRQLDHIQYSC